MRKLLLKSVCSILICVIAVLSFPISASSYDTYTYQNFSHCDNIRLMQNENQVFLVAVNSNKVYIEAVYPSSYNIELTLENNVYSYNLFDTTLVFVCPIAISKQTQVVIYDIDTDNIYSFVVSFIDSFEFSEICFYDNSVYLSCNDGVIRKYSKYGNLLNCYQVTKNLYHLVRGLYSDIYACSSGGIYKLSTGSVTQFFADNIFAPIKFVSDNVFVNRLGYYYRLDTNSISKLTDYKSTVSFPSGGLIDNHYIVAEENIIFAVDGATDEKDKYHNLHNYAHEICVIGSDLFVLSYQNGIPAVSVIPYSDFIKYNDNTSDSDTTNNNSEIGSSVYNIDLQRRVITNIPHSTTVAKLKKNIYFKDYNLSFTRYDGKEITSGNIGTATIVRFYNNDYSKEFELSVVGDLTGEGNVNSRDRKMLFSFLLDEVSFSGVYCDSADINNSGGIDTSDLVLLLRMIEEQK
ncbi:MAG: dockerin type I repeat-containing protein [Ruminococcus sp.]|nr:dockerin type I repeat-containing protein [Ruminococcus sp.]